MKKKICIIILSIVIVCSLLSGCGDKHTAIIMKNAKDFTLTQEISESFKQENYGIQSYAFLKYIQENLPGRIAGTEKEKEMASFISAILLNGGYSEKDIKLNSFDIEEGVPMIDVYKRQIQGWLDAYKGTHVCSVQIWKEAFDHFDREPKKFETNEICSIMDTQITGWKRAGIHRFEKQGYGRQRSWIREGTEDEGVNEPDKDGFTKLTKAEQLELPFYLPDREKG